MEKKIEIIAVDFDGTLCSECYPAIGMPNLPLFALLKGARRQGKKVILWTCRCGDLLEEAVAWCRMFGLEFDAVKKMWRRRWNSMERNPEKSPRTSISMTRRAGRG